MNYGYQNEKDFINNKYLNELDKKSQEFLKELFNDNIDNDEIIKSWEKSSSSKC